MYETGMGRRDIVAGVLLGAFALGGGAMTTVGPGLYPDYAQEIFWIGLIVAALALIGLLLLFVWKPKEAAMTDDTEMGDNNTLYGNVKPPKKMGSGNTIVGPTDAHGNTIINTPTSVGAGAGFDPTGVIIGAGAGANLGRKKKSDGA